jgi:hypothetical protein
MGRAYMPICCPLERLSTFIASKAVVKSSGERDRGTHWIVGWVNPRADLENVEKRKFLTLPGLELQPLGRPAHSQSLYRLPYTKSISIFRRV